MNSTVTDKCGLSKALMFDGEFSSGLNVFRGESSFSLRNPSGTAEQLPGPCTRCCAPGLRWEVSSRVILYERLLGHFPVCPQDNQGNCRWFPF